MTTDAASGREPPGALPEPPPESPVGASPPPLPASPSLPVPAPLPASTPESQASPWDSALSPPPSTKPTLRGVSHQVAFFVAVVAGGALVATSVADRQRLANAIYVATLAAMYGMSAFYHRPTWSPERRRLLRKLDHAAIYLVIAGTATPICMLALPPDSRGLLLTLVWAMAGLGIAKSLAWAHAPRALTAALYLLFGAAFLPFLPTFVTHLGGTNVALLAGGGAAYAVGAVIYALRRPDPLPWVFGYHEIFHALVIVGSVCHFLVIMRVGETFLARWPHS